MNEKGNLGSKPLMLGNDENWVSCERETSRLKNKKKKRRCFAVSGFCKLRKEESFFFRSKKIPNKNGDLPFRLAHINLLGWAKPTPVPGPEGKSVI
jgi:hypothetical protein